MTPPWRQIVQEVSTATSLDDALPRVVRRVRNSLSVDVCSVYLTDEGADQFVLTASDGLGSESAGRVRVGQHEGPLGLVREGEELVVRQFLGARLLEPSRSARAVAGTMGAWRRDRQFRLQLIPV